MNAYNQAIDKDGLLRSKYYQKAESTYKESVELNKNKLTIIYYSSTPNSFFAIFSYANSPDSIANSAMNSGNTALSSMICSFIRGHVFPPALLYAAMSCSRPSSPNYTMMSHEIH